MIRVSCGTGGSGVCGVFNFPAPPKVVSSKIMRPSKVFHSVLCDGLGRGGVSAGGTIFILGSTHVTDESVRLPLIGRGRLGRVVTVGTSSCFPISLDRCGLMRRVVRGVSEPRRGGLHLSIVTIPGSLVLSCNTLTTSYELRLMTLSCDKGTVGRLVEERVPKSIGIAIGISRISAALAMVSKDVMGLRHGIGRKLTSTVRTVRSDRLFKRCLSFASTISITHEGAYLTVEPSNAMPSRPTNNNVSPVKRRVSSRHFGGLHLGMSCSLSGLVDDLKQIVSCCRSEGSSAPVREVFLVNLNTSFDKLSGLLAGRLGIGIIPLRRFSNVRITGDVGLTRTGLTRCFGYIKYSLDPLSVLSDGGGGKVNTPVVTKATTNTVPSNNTRTKVRKGPPINPSKGPLPMPTKRRTRGPISFTIRLLVFNLYIMITINVATCDVFSGLILASSGVALGTHISSLSCTRGVCSICGRAGGSCS